MVCNWKTILSAAEECGFKGDFPALFGSDGDLTSITFSQVAPMQAGLLEDFMAWIKATYGGTRQMFDAVEESGTVSFERMLAACEDIQNIYKQIIFLILYMNPKNTFYE